MAICGILPFVMCSHWEMGIGDYQALLRGQDAEDPPASRKKGRFTSSSLIWPLTRKRILACSVGGVERANSV